MVQRAGISGRAVGLASVGGLFVYAGLRGENPLVALRGVLTGSPAPVPTGKPVTLELFSGGSIDGTTRTGVPASAVAGRAADIALQQLGKMYLFGAAGPDRFDCSGLVSYAFNHAGASGFGRMTTPVIAISPKFRKISRSEVQKGDLLWHVGHVAIAISNSQLVEAPHFGVPVRTRSISGFTMYLRYVGTGSTTPPPSVRNPRGRVGR
jgi:cell wall-associated NlpC family hydrolase